VFDQATAGTYAGVISGSGSLTKAGTGTLVLSGANTYSGGTTVSAGILQGSTTSLQGNIANNATVSFNQSSDGTYAGVISGSGALTKAGTGTLVLTGSNTYSGGTIISAGTLQGTTTSLQGNIVNNATVVFDQAATGTYAGNLSGSGALIMQGSGTVFLTGTNTYTGGTTVIAGRLSINGEVTGNVQVDTGGNLGGSGLIVGNVVNAGSLAPGNSIGTLTVGGNFRQNGGVYQVEVNNAGQSDRLNVGGTATINGGTVQVLAQPGTYARNTTYTILNAAGGVSGTYSNVTSNFAFLTPSLSYDANNVYLLLFQTTSAFAAGAQTPHQFAVGTALDIANPTATSGDFNTVLNALSLLSTVQGPAALNAISGQNYAGLSNGVVQNAQLFMNNFATQAGGSAGTRRVPIAEACDGACDSTRPGQWSGWGAALGGTGTIAGNANAGALTYSSGGFAAGVDRRFAPNFLMGVTIGYLTGSQWTDGFAGRGMSDAVLGGLYGSYREAGFYFDGLAGYAYTDNQLQRTILIPGLSARNAWGRTGVNQFLGHAETGYRFELGGNAQPWFTPFARLQVTTAWQNAFSESGANSLNLNVAAQTTSSLRTVLGGQLGASLDMGWRENLDVQFRMGWSHEFGDVGRPVTAAFAGAPAVPFTVYGASPQRDGILLGLGAATGLAAGTSLFLRYEGNIAGLDSNHALSLGLRVSW
jgi:outer membrane autotransporter protein